MCGESPSVAVGQSPQQYLSKGALGMKFVQGMLLEWFSNQGEGLLATKMGPTVLLWPHGCRIDQRWPLRDDPCPQGLLEHTYMGSRSKR